MKFFNIVCFIRMHNCLVFLIILLSLFDFFIKKIYAKKTNIQDDQQVVLYLGKNVYMRELDNEPAFGDELFLHPGTHTVKVYSKYQEAGDFLFKLSEDKVVTFNCEIGKKYIINGKMIAWGIYSYTINEYIRKKEIRRVGKNERNGLTIDIVKMYAFQNEYTFLTPSIGYRSNPFNYYFGYGYVRPPWIHAKEYYMHEHFSSTDKIRDLWYPEDVPNAFILGLDCNLNLWNYKNKNNKNFLFDTVFGIAFPFYLGTYTYAPSALITDGESLIGEYISLDYYPLILIIKVGFKFTFFHNYVMEYTYSPSIHFNPNKNQNLFNHGIGINIGVILSSKEVKSLFSF